MDLVLNGIEEMNEQELMMVQWYRDWETRRRGDWMTGRKGDGERN